MSTKSHRATWLLSICVLGIGACSDGPGAPQAEGDSAELAALEQRIDAAAALTDRLKAVQSGQAPAARVRPLLRGRVFGTISPTCSPTLRSGTTRKATSARRRSASCSSSKSAKASSGSPMAESIRTSRSRRSSRSRADGKSAKARWRIVAMLGGYGGSASFARGVYENAYVEENGVWKVQEISFFNQVGGRYGESLRPTVAGPLDAPSSRVSLRAR